MRNKGFTMSLKGLAAETVSISDRARYVTASGRAVDFTHAMRATLADTSLYTPEALSRLVASLEPPETRHDTIIQVTGETTSECARRLAVDERAPSVFALNFASAKNPGGGFLGGAKAQEEDLCRVSALYSTQLVHRAYYDANRATDSMIYTDHAIYSPGVAFFRDESLALLEEPFFASVLTMPAPNAGEHLRRDSRGHAMITEALDRRVAMALAVARARGDRTLVLGAWGCGVFRNDPDEVAALFAKWLADPRFAGAFERVVFAVYDRKGGVNRAAFERVFAG
jgi:uncharacterized protein (TIGR02452 family)